MLATVWLTSAATAGTLEITTDPPFEVIEVDDEDLKVIFLNEITPDEDGKRTISFSCSPQGQSGAVTEYLWNFGDHANPQQKDTADAGPIEFSEEIMQNGQVVTVGVTHIADGVTCSSKGNPVSFIHLLPIKVQVVDRDDPTKVWGSEENHDVSEPVYAGESCGDMVSWKLARSGSWEDVTFKWTAEGPDGETITGPTGAGENEWTINDDDDDDATDWLTWKPGEWKIKVEIGSVTTEFEQEVGVRSQDVLVIGWIDPSKVPLDSSDVHEDILAYFRPDGQFFHTFARLEAAAILSQIAGGDLSGPNNGADLTVKERTYLLNWLFKYDGNPSPPETFENEDKVDEFVEKNERTEYKLINRLQVKYLINDDGKFDDRPSPVKNPSGNERVIAELGTTRNHVSLGLHPGVPGPAHGLLVFSEEDDQVQLINDGRPDNIGVATINALASPKKWSNIGSCIRFRPDDPHGYEVKVQVYPTFYIYEKDKDGKFDRIETIEQAPEPIGNFSEDPYPNGPAPFIDY